MRNLSVIRQATKTIEVSDKGTSTFVNIAFIEQSKEIEALKDTIASLTRQIEAMRLEVSRKADIEFARESKSMRDSMAMQEAMKALLA
jgi:hypothetical protein